MEQGASAPIYKKKKKKKKGNHLPRPDHLESLNHVDLTIFSQESKQVQNACPACNSGWLDCSIGWLRKHSPSRFIPHFIPSIHPPLPRNSLPTTFNLHRRLKRPVRRTGNRRRQPGSGAVIYCLRTRLQSPGSPRASRALQPSPTIQPYPNFGGYSLNWMLDAAAPFVNHPIDARSTLSIQPNAAQCF